MAIQSAEIAAALHSYARPYLVWQSVTGVCIAKGQTLTGGTTAAAILFPDGDLRTTTSTTFLDFLITRNAVFTTPAGAQSGLYTGQSESVNTWYAMYAVKIQGASAEFVLVGDHQYQPSRGQVPNLNTRYGTNSWIFLGFIRNGDNSGATGDILRFQQIGSRFLFTNLETDIAGNGGVGLRLAASAATSITYPISPGMGVGGGGTAVDIPSFSQMTCWAASGGPSAASEFVGRTSTNTQRYFDVSLATGNRGVQTFETGYFAQSITVSGTTTGSGLDLNLLAWNDVYLTGNWSVAGGD